MRQRHGPIGVLDFARIDPEPWQPQDLAAAAGFARRIVATLQLATAPQQQAHSPALRIAVEHDMRIEQARGVMLHVDPQRTNAWATYLRRCLGGRSSGGPEDGPA